VNIAVQIHNLLINEFIYVWVNMKKGFTDGMYNKRSLEARGFQDNHKPLVVFEAIHTLSSTFLLAILSISRHPMLP
jgi:hypothetical protein